MFLICCYMKKREQNQGCCMMCLVLFELCKMKTNLLLEHFTSKWNCSYWKYISNIKAPSSDTDLTNKGYRGFHKHRSQLVLRMAQHILYILYYMKSSQSLQNKKRDPLGSMDHISTCIFYWYFVSFLCSLIHISVKWLATTVRVTFIFIYLF